MTLAIIGLLSGIVAAIPFLYKWWTNAQEKKAKDVVAALQQKSDEVFKPLEQGGTTSEQKDQAAKDIADLISGK